MRALYDPARHEPLADLEWRPARARDAIAAICRDAEVAFDHDRLWPLHPADDEPGTPRDGILRGLYVGAAGMLHALGRLGEAGLHVSTLDGAAIVDGLHEAALASPDEREAGASLLVGSSGILLVAHRLAPSAAGADALAMHALDEVARFRAATGRGRYTLFTGDVGAALLAAACLRGAAAFPGLDDL